MMEVSTSRFDSKSVCSKNVTYRGIFEVARKYKGIFVKKTLKTKFHSFMFSVCVCVLGGGFGLGGLKIFWTQFVAHHICILDHQNQDPGSM